MVKSVDSSGREGMAEQSELWLRVWIHQAEKVWQSRVSCG